MQSDTRRSVRILGITQGVGFRPFVWRLAKQFDLTGWVQNDSSGLRLEIQGSPAGVDGFLTELQESPPPLARLDTIDVTEVPIHGEDTQFVIRTSEMQEGASNPVTQDICICIDCIGELTNPDDRRHRYPFINCTNCGPRFTIIEDVPYDRPATTMKSFHMCHRCQGEYDDPADRRFHAQPNACPDCGPHIWWATGNNAQSPTEHPLFESSQEPDTIAHFAKAIFSGQVVAVKGIGGFHLVCDARNAAAIAILRERKGRIDKPFAVMTANVEQIREFAVVQDEEETLLKSKERPIVLLRKKSNSRHDQMLASVAPGNQFIGVMLPYSPLHYLLIEALSPLVVTSGNISDEPIVRTNDEASARLSRLADSFLLHNRHIHIVCDDSVIRCVEGRPLPIRRSRGYAPMPVRLRKDGPSVLAVGGEIKATFCITKNDYAYLSQHIGDVGNLETLTALQRNVDHFLRLFRIDVDAIAGDLHPEYLSSQWAQQLAEKLRLPYLPVQHHVAHAASLLAERESNNQDSIIACCFDGTGYGLDGAIWGGEFLLTNDHKFERVAHMRYFPLPGGDASIKRPYRVALALLQSLGLEWDEHLPSVAACSKSERGLLRKQITRQLNCVNTSSMGRLFDSVASLIGIRHEVSYEAQAAMEMEAMAAELVDEVDPGSYFFTVVESDPLEVCYKSVVRAICEDVTNGVDRRIIAAKFHHAVAAAIHSVSDILRKSTDLHRVGLTGGVFQNVLLLELTERVLKEDGFEVLSHSVVPPNDGGLALGQAVVAQSLFLKNKNTG